VADVAYEAGVTRVTIYRYFGDKQGLVEAVCRHLADTFHRAAEGDLRDSTQDVDARLTRLGEELSCLPRGNLLARLDEIRCLYPAAYEELRTARENALNRMFEQAVAVATREHKLREDINLQVARAMFWASVTNLVESPALIISNVSYAEICETVTAILRHGMLKNDGDDEGTDRAIANGNECTQH
jgi:AcrR family transcriptional regulator